MILTATEMGLGTLWIANTCFAYDNLMEVIQSEGKLIGAVTVGYPEEQPIARPRKKFEDVIEYRE